MPKKARPIRKPRKTAPARSPATNTPQHPFAYVAFADLHVEASTLMQACAVLDEVGAAAEEREADIVFLGDFWTLRGTLNVRQVDEVLKRVEQWKRRAYMIPGNHDQVTIDGLIHGLNIFRGMPNITVVDEPFIESKRVGFVPWRERDQQGSFAWMTAPDVTIFGHAEVSGAIANGGHKAAGRVSLETLGGARAVYLGHYHKRQLLGDNTWYLGSPYAQNAGERDWPHGIAVITHKHASPDFIELTDLPRYWRFDIADEFWDLSQVREQDIVEVVAPAAAIGTPEYRKAVEPIPATTVRAKPTNPAGEAAPPSFALNLSDALSQYADENGGEVAEELKVLGREILAEVPEAHTLPALGTPTEVVHVRAKNFCALAGEVELPASDIEFTLLRGPIGSGKTAVADAITWCLFGQTSPRKAGQQGATLRGDHVIHDGASECSVECALTVAGKAVRITRTKKRGKGAKVSWEGIETPEGISDNDAFVESIVGLPYYLWRACVSLGQGAVANFATDADKRRKELLEYAFGLTPCPAAQTVARRRLAVLETSVGELEQQQTAAEAQLEVLTAMDFDAQMEQWEEQRKSTLEGLKSRGEEVAAKVAECKKLLAAEAEWERSREQHEHHIADLTNQLAKSGTAKRVAELQRQFGAIEAEKGVIQRDLHDAQTRLNTLVSQAQGGGTAVCSECGQPLVRAEDHIAPLEQTVRGKNVELSNLEARRINVAEQLDRLNSEGSSATEHIQASISESKAALEKCATALNQFVRVRANLETAEVQLNDARQRYREQSALKNPHAKAAEETQKRLEEINAQLSDIAAERKKQTAEAARVNFWVGGFGPKGIPVLVLRTAIYDLEAAANRYLAALLDGKVYCQLSMEGDDLKIDYRERQADGQVVERSYEQLSGGQRRCVELAFSPLALSDTVFARLGVRVPLLVIDELTTHLGEAEKRRACELLAGLGRRVFVIDHDPSVQGHFDHVWQLERNADGVELVRP